MTPTTPSTAPGFLALFKPGRWVYQLWHRPRGWWRQTRAWGGILQRWRMWRGEIHMQRAARRLPAAAGVGPPLVVHYLSGARFWHQTLFCAWSLARTSGRALHVHVYDDGSLPVSAIQALQRVFADVQVHTRDACLARLQARLPQSHYPQLHALWHSYPNIRKLLDPHLAGTGPKMVLDSDMLYFRRPQALLDWMDSPQNGLYMRDAIEAYGYPRALLEDLAGAPLDTCVNVGITGLNGDLLDFARLESWCATLLERHGRHYFLEQALIATWMAGHAGRCLPEADYRLCCTDRGEYATGCLEHYVAAAKPLYFIHAWRACLARLSQLPDASASAAVPTPRP